MIAFVEGTLVESGPESVVVVGGVGLDLRLSMRTAGSLPPVGDTVRLWTHLAVREDAWTLYGFLSQEERSMFRLLNTVSGIGPKVALGMLSAASAADLALYLRQGDEKGLTRLPGIGKKSAARLIVELGQKVPDSWFSDSAGAPAIVAGGALGEAVSILQAMGLAPAQAEQALTRARRVDESLSEDLEKWVRAALAVM